MSLVATNSTCFDIQSDHVSDRFENRETTGASATPVCESLTASLNDLPDSCSQTLMASATSSESGNVATDELPSTYQYNDSSEVQEINVLSKISSQRSSHISISDKVSNAKSDDANADTRLPSKSIYASLLSEPTLLPDTSQENDSLVHVKSEKINDFSQQTINEKCDAQPVLLSNAAQRIPDDIVLPPRFSEKIDSQCTSAESRTHRITDNTCLNKPGGTAQEIPMSEDFTQQHVIQKITEKSSVSVLQQSGSNTGESSVSHRPDPNIDSHDENNFLTYWNAEKQSDCELKLIPNIQLHQPPPNINSIKETFLKDFNRKRLYLFLDYDGTLTPIVKNPWEAVLSPSVRQLLYDLAADSNGLITVGIVTGRALTSVKNFVQIIASEHLNFIYAASHGFHIEAAGKMLHHRVGSKFIPILKKAAAELEILLEKVEGVMLEDNEFAISVHYRNAVITDAESVVEAIISDVLKCYPELKMTRGKKVFELRINVTWNKGRAVFWLLNAMRVDPFDTDTRVVYIGDDLTDEDAFRAVRALDNSLTILVSDIPDHRPTAASCYVNNPDEVADLLRLFLGIARNPLNL